jgi:hypothetical protein
VDVSQNHQGGSINVPAREGAPSSQSIDWYAEGEARDVEVAGVRVTVRLVGRKGRRARIAITAPAGALFSARDMTERVPSSNRST